MTKSSQPAIVTIGNFDGVHLGHQKLIHQVADRARALGLGSLAVTFEPHDFTAVAQRRNADVANSR